MAAHQVRRDLLIARFFRQKIAVFEAGMSVAESVARFALQV